MAKKRFFQESELVFEEKCTKYKAQDLQGMKFGRLFVLGYAGKTTHSQWYCKCDCGKIIKAPISHLKSGHTTSCGCFLLEVITKHGYIKNNKVSSIYSI